MRALDNILTFKLDDRLKKNTYLKNNRVHLIQLYKIVCVKLGPHK